MPWILSFWIRLNNETRGNHPRTASSDWLDAHGRLTMASTQSKTPVHSHPLSPDQIPTTKGRKGRLPLATPDSRSPSTSTLGNYFTLKAQLEQQDRSENWDGSVRGYGQTEKRRVVEAHSSVKMSSPSLGAIWDNPTTIPPTAPLFVVGATQEHLLTPEVHITPESEVDGVDPTVSAQVLATKWHTYSDEAIQATISQLGASDSPADKSSHPYHTALRVLSSAVNNLSRARLELEETRKALREKEVAKKKRADALLRELQPSEQEVARRVIQSLFTDDDENGHRVRRKLSVLVCYSLFFKTTKLSNEFSSLSQNPLLRLSQTKCLCRAVSRTIIWVLCRRKLRRC